MSWGNKKRPKDPLKQGRVISDDLGHETAVGLPKPTNVFHMSVPCKSAMSRGVQWCSIVHLVENGPETQLNWV
eukprot:12344255-Prorocentrum_lima.AAC.1